MSATETTEEALTGLGVAVAATLRVVEATAIGLVTVFIAPPLVILAAVVVIPLAALAAVAGLVALPVLAARRVHRHRVAHPHQFVHRLLSRAQRKQYA
jgi:membrane protein YdbS with pleckstrin-like domain